MSARHTSSRVPSLPRLLRVLSGQPGVHLDQRHRCVECVDCCWLSQDAALSGAWLSVVTVVVGLRLTLIVVCCASAGSPYNDLAYCEQFPRNSSYWGNTTAAAEAAAAAPAGTFQYWAQVGKAVVPDSRFDNIGWALVTVFQIITTENCKPWCVV